MLYIPRLMGRAVDVISGASSRNSDSVSSLMFQMIFLAVLVAVGRFGWRNCIIGAARKIENTLRMKLYSHLLFLTSSFYQRHKVGDLMARSTHDIQSIRMTIGMALIALIDGSFMIIVILSSLIFQYGRLGIIVFLPLPLVTAMTLVFGRRLAPSLRIAQKRFAGISEHVQEVLQGIRVIKSFAREKFKLEQFAKINADYASANLNVIRLWGLLFPSLRFFSGLTLTLLLYFGGLQVLSGALRAGDFVVILSYLGMLMWPAMQAGWVINMTQRGAAAMERINEILDEEPDIKDLAEARTFIESDSLFFRSLSYRYSHEQNVLNDISFTVQKEKTTGVLGRTGSGKTTLVKLLSRLLEPPPGTIFLGEDLDIRKIKRSTLRNVISVAPQDIFLFSASIRDNIIFSSSNLSQDDLKRCIEISGFEKDLHLFPQGLETQVGERGVSVSGGQKQRIAIARALLVNSDILILDDALSAVDADMEELILENIFTYRRDKTTILITHRISALSRCDCCIVIENGIVTANDTHAKLVRRKGLYRDIYELQTLERIEMKP